MAYFSLLFYLVNQIILQSASYFPELTSSLYLTAGTGLLLKNRRNLHKLWWSSWQRTLQITNFNLLFCSVLFVSSVNVLKGYYNVSINLVAVATVWILKRFLTQLLEKDAKLWHTQVIVSYPGRSCSSNKPVGGADNKQTDVVWEISLRKQPTFLDARHHWFHQEITWRTLKRSNSIHTDDAQLTTQIWTVLLIGWSKCLTNQKHYLCLGSDTSSAWNFYLRSSDVISPEK